MGRQKRAAFYSSRCDWQVFPNQFFAKKGTNYKFDFSNLFKILCLALSGRYINPTIFSISISENKFELGGMKSSPPGADPSVNYLVNVDQFILTNIFPSNLGAIDLETANERLYFRIIEPPQVGFITHLR